MFKRFLTKGVVFAVISLVVIGAFVLNTTGKTAGQAKADFSRATDALRTKSTAKDGGRVGDIAQTLLGYGFASQEGINLAHDKVFRVKAAAAFNEGRAISLIGNNAQEDLKAASDEFLKKSGEIGITSSEVAAKLASARGFLKDKVFTEDLIQRIFNEIAKIDESKVQKDVEKKSAKKNALDFLATIKKISTIQEVTERNKQAKKVLLEDTRFIVFLFGEKGLDNSLFSVGNILSQEHKELVSHIGTYPYAGSENVQGGARTLYLTLARIAGLQDMGQQGVEALQEMMLHEFLDMANGRHVEPSAKVKAMLSKTNEVVDKKYREVERSFVTEVMETGSVLVSNDKVKVEKYRLVDDLGKKDSFAIHGSSKVHSDVPKGQELTITIAKADTGSIGGHGTAPGKMLEAVAEEWAQAAERGEIVDFFITRVGDDISVTVTHVKGKDNEAIHKHIWDGFMRSSVVAKDLGYYGAGQDMLAEAFSGNVRGAGPSVAEMIIKEQASEVVIFCQADKTAPGAFNKGLWNILFGPDTTWRPLGPGEARKIKVGMLDFDYNDNAGRHIWFEKGDYDDAYWYGGYPDRYTYDLATLGNGEEFLAVTAQRLGIIAGEYVGKDDPMFMIRSQKKFPAVGEITSAFLKGEYFVPGWMRGSNKGPFFPVSLTGAKIGIYDGPPLFSMWSFNLNKGRLEGFYDLFAANDAIKYVQQRRAAAAVRQLEEGFHEMGLRLGPEEIEYQKGPTLIEAALKDRWEVYAPEKDGGDDIEEQKNTDKIWDSIGQHIIASKTIDTSRIHYTNTWGVNLANFAISFPKDIHHRVSDKALVANSKKDGKVYPILLNHEFFLKKSPDGVMALQSLAEQLGKGNIKFVLHINRDDVKPAEADRITDEVLAKINSINGDYTKLTRDVFSAVVVGTNIEAVAKQVNDKLKADIFEVIGPEKYVSQFKSDKIAKIALDTADVTKGQSESLSMAKALKLGVELVPAEGKIKEAQLTELDKLFSQDTTGTFHVAPVQAVKEVETKAVAYQKAVEAAEIRI